MTPSGPSAASPSESFAGERIIPLRRPWLWSSSAALVLVIGALAVSLFRNPKISHAVIAQYQWAPAIMRGLLLTVELTILAAVLGLVLGIVLAMMRLSESPVFRGFAGLYVWIVRGTPLLVQILMWGNLALLFEHIGPFDTNSVMTPFVASVVALGLNEAAYMAEVVRAGILGVDRGQFVAALSLGMSRALAMRRIILPQAMRTIIPPAGNQFISLLKATSLVSVIAGGDLLTSAENISSANLRTIELMLVATFWYLILTSITSLIQYFIERRLARAGTGIHDAH